MTDYKTTKRIQALLTLFQAASFKSKEDICDRLRQDFGIDISERTLERDFKNLRENYDIDIRYSKSLGIYELPEENLPDITSFLKFSRIVDLGSFINKRMNNLDTLEQYVDMFADDNFKGFDLVESILLAIQKQRDLIFLHENYYEGTIKNYQITPLKIKEYLNRWYVMGVTRGEKDFKIFGLDRITKLKSVPGSKIKRFPFDDHVNGYNKIIGLTYDPASKPEKVVLRVQEKQIKYLRALPLHHTQKIELKDGAKYGIVTYTLIPNYELQQELLKLNFMVEVLEPLKLRREIKSLLEATLKHYN